MKTEKFSINFILLLALFFIAGDCYGQFAKYVPGSSSIEIDLGTTKIKRENIQKIYLITEKEENGQKVSVSKIYTRDQISGGGTGLLANVLSIPAPADMPSDLSANPVQLDILVKPDPAKPGVTVIPITVNPVGVRVPYGQMLERLELEQTKAKGKDDAELYASGSVTTAIGSAPNWVADFKYEREFGKKGFPFLFAPFANLKYNSKVKNDTDKLSFGIKFSNSFGFKTSDSEIEEDRPINVLLDNTEAAYGDTPKFTKIKRQREQRQYFLYIGTGEFESDWDFRVNNIITSQEIHYLVKPKFFNGGKLIFTPFAGAELGYNLKNPTAREDHGISRLKGGAVLTLDLEKPFGDFIGKDLVWENKFTQRWFLAKEFAYDKNDSGELVEKAFGKAPRSHFISTLEFKINDFFGPAISYEWGEVPPLYNKIKHKVKFGLVYSFKRKALP